MSAPRHIDPVASYDELARHKHPLRSALLPLGTIVAWPTRHPNRWRSRGLPVWRYLVIGCPHIMDGRHAWHHSEDEAQACAAAVRRAAGAKNHNRVLREMT